LILTPLIQFQIGQKNTEQKMRKSKIDITISPYVKPFATSGADELEASQVELAKAQFLVLDPSSIGLEYEQFVVILMSSGFCWALPELTLFESKSQYAAYPLIKNRRTRRGKAVFD
jgi:hypothetical protein